MRPFEARNALVQPGGDAAAAAGPALVDPEIQYAGPASIFLGDQGTGVDWQYVTGKQKNRNQQQQGEKTQCRFQLPHVITPPNDAI
jgi:hypothetical protein